MKSFPNVFCIVDTETTGTRAGFSRIIDIAIIRVEHGKVVKRYETLLNPGISIPNSITGITGITTEDVVSAPSFDEVALTIQELLDGAVFVAHNVSFDYNFIKQEFKRIGIEWNAQKLCSVNLSRTLFPKEKSHNLDSIILKWNISIKARHRAMPDAEAVLMFFKKLSKIVEKEMLEEALQHVLDKPSSRGNMNDLPDNSGVYFFYGEDQDLLYIGKSKHVRTRVKSHFHTTAITSSGKSSTLNKETVRVDTISTSGELSALLLEASLIKQHSPVYNKLLRKKKKLTIARKVVDDEGYTRIVLEIVSDIQFSDNIVGVWKNTHQAKNRLESIAKEYSLCLKLLNLEHTKTTCFNYQLNKCDGACVGKIPQEVYNSRVDNAFEKRKIHIWPYKGIISIIEKESEDRGTVFFIDNWILLSSFKFENGEYERFGEYEKYFEYDTYKILSRYILNRANKSTLRVITSIEYKKQLAHMTNTYDTTVYIS